MRLFYQYFVAHAHIHSSARLSKLFSFSIIYYLALFANIPARPRIYFLKNSGSVRPLHQY